MAGGFFEIWKGNDCFGWFDYCLYLVYIGIIQARDEMTWLPGSLGAYALCISKCSGACGRGPWGWGSRYSGMFDACHRWNLLWCCYLWLILLKICVPKTPQQWVTFATICDYLWKPIWSHHFELMPFSPFSALMTLSSSLFCLWKRDGTANSERTVPPQA